jgi:CRISPR/Cas system CSM-associated protein Csm4 (group 5 of RAMP superfamily)
LTLSVPDEGYYNLLTMSVPDEGYYNLLTLSVPDEGYYNLLTLSVPDEGYSETDRAQVYKIGIPFISTLIVKKLE